MSRKPRRTPGVIVHILLACLSFLTALCLLAAGFTGVLAATCTDRDMHTTLAVSDENIARQRGIIDRLIGELAEKQSFDPACLDAFTSVEALRAYNRDIAAWWPTLLTDKSTAPMPSISKDAVLEAVMNDPTFQSTHDKTKQKSVARDKIAGKVVSILEETAAPLRFNLLPMGLSMVTKKIDIYQYMPLVPWLPWLCLAAAGVMIALMMLLSARRPVRGIFFVGNSAVAAGLLTALAILGIAILNPLQFIAQYSSSFAGTIAPWLNRMGLWTGLWAAGLMVVGLLLILWHQHGMASLRRKLGSDL